MTLKKRIAAGLALVFMPLLALAQNWPVTVKDLDNRTVTVEREPQRIILQDGRDILAMSLLDRDNPCPHCADCTNLHTK